MEVDSNSDWDYQPVAERAFRRSAGVRLRLVVENAERDFDAQRDRHGDNNTHDAKQNPAGQKTEDHEHGAYVAGAP